MLCSISSGGVLRDTFVTSTQVAEDGTLTSPKVECQSEEGELVGLSKTLPLQNVIGDLSSAAGDNDSDEICQVKGTLY